MSWISNRSEAVKQGGRSCITCATEPASPSSWHSGTATTLSPNSERRNTRLRIRKLLPNKNKLPTDAESLGRWGEEHSEKFLKRKGFKSLTRNFSCKSGEIDLIMVDNDGAIVFIEVKTRANEDFSPSESAITGSKKTRMIRTARYFLASNNIAERPFRFDVVIIVLGEKNRPEIRHYENAFVP